MIFDLSGKEKSVLLGAAEIALGLMGPFKEHGLDVASHENAAGKNLCGMCGYKAAEKGVWRCKGVPIQKEYGGVYFHTCPAPDGICPGFFKKPSIPRPPQPKKKGRPVPAGVKFVYFGAPQGKTKKGVPQHKGVVTAAWISPAPGVLHLGFSFCSPQDPWCKAKGRDMAAARLLKRTGPTIAIRYLLDVKRTVHEVVKVILNHDFEIIEALVPGATAWGHCRVPSWTKGLGKRMEKKERMLGERIKRLRVPSLPDFLGGFYIAPPTRELPFNIMARMMADIAAQGID